MKFGNSLLVLLVLVLTAQTAHGQGLEGLSDSTTNMGQEGGLSAGITCEELDHIAGIGATVLENQVQGYSIPQVDLPNLNVKLKDVSINTLHIPNATIGTSTGKIRPNLTVCSNITMKYEFCYNFFGINFCDKGDASLEANASMATDMNVTTVGGKYKMDIDHCESIVTGVRPRVTSSSMFGSLYSSILPLFTDTLQSEIQKHICPQVEESVKANSKAVVDSFKKDACVDDLSCIDFSLTNSPLVDSAFVASAMKGEFFSSLKRKAHNFSSGNVTMNPPANHSHCNYYFHGTDYIINTAMDVYYEAQRMKFSFCMPSVFAEILPECVVDFMTEFHCDESKLLSLGPPEDTCHNDVKVYLNASSMPSMKIVKDKMISNFSVEIDIVKGQCSLCAMKLTAHSEGSVSFKETASGHNVTGHVNAFKVVFPKDDLCPLLKLIIAQNPYVSEASITAIVDVVGDKFVLPVLNSKLGVGFPLPEFDHIRLVKPAIRLNDGFATICFDVEYSP